MILLILACAPTAQVTAPAAPPVLPEVPVVPEVSAPAPVPEVPAVVPPIGHDPGTIYAACRDRLEGIEADAECATDADCKVAGCSQEVCVTAAVAPEIMTTCERSICISVIDACGCHDGRCTWTLRSELMLRKIPGVP